MPIVVIMISTLCLLPATGQTPQLVAGRTESVMMQNEYLRVDFDVSRGALSVVRLDGKGFSLVDGSPSVKGSFGTAKGEVTSAVQERFSDRVGRGERLVVSLSDPSTGTSLMWRARLYDGKPWVSLALDVSRKDGTLDEITPLQADVEAQGQASGMRALINGGAIGSANGSVPLVTKGVASRFVTSVYDPASDSGLGLGFYSYRRAMCEIQIKSRIGKRVVVSALSRYFGHDLALEKGMKGEDLLLDFSIDPLAGLENYAVVTQRETKAHPNRDVQMGMLNPWFYYGSAMTAGDILAEAEKLTHSILFRNYGITAISSGLWQKGHWELKSDKPEQDDWSTILGFGEEKDDPERYPMGIEVMEKQLISMGVQPMRGGFYSFAGKLSTVRLEHPDWIDAEGCIDFTRPAAQDWIGGVYGKAAKYGVRYFWTDNNVLPSDPKQYNPRMVRGFENARAGMSAIRKAIGPEAILATYSSPTNYFIGITDRVRVSWDMGTFGVWPYLTQIARDVAASYFYNGRLWMTDPDPVFVDSSNNPQTLEEARMRVGLGVCAGSFITLGEDVSKYSPERQRLLTLDLPSYGVAAIPLDLMRRDVAEENWTPVKTKWGSWDVLIYQNWNADSRTYRVDAKALGLADRKTYLVYDFWPRKLLGEYRPDMGFEVPGHTCRVLLIKAKPKQPAVLSTDMHLLQGAVDLSDVRYDRAQIRLSGKATRHPGAEGRIAVYVPEGFAVVKSNVPMDQISDRLVDLVLTFPEATQSWNIEFTHR